MKKYLFTIILVCLMVTPVFAVTKTVVLTWTPNSEEDINGYTGFQYSSSTDTTVDATWTVSHPTATKSTAIDVPNNTNVTICFELDAYALSNNHSGHSPRVCTTISGSDTLPPSAPTNIKITVQ